MRNNKWGGKRLLKKEYLKKESLCRWLSLLLGFCMLLSLLGGVASFPAFAREIGQTKPEEETWGEVTQQIESEEEIGRTELKEETREETKTRLLRQIMEEGWDPYSETMSMDEFYALAELFQEGILPLEEDSVKEISATDKELDELESEESETEESEGEESETEESEGEESETEESESEESETEESEGEESETEESESEESETEESEGEESETEESEGEESETEESEGEESEAEESEGEESETEESESEESKTEESEGEESETDEPGNEDSGMDESDDAEEPMFEELGTEMSNPHSPSFDNTDAAEIAGVGLGQSTDVYIPRTMFLFRGVHAKDGKDSNGNDVETSLPGMDAEGIEHGRPLEYDNENGVDENGDGVIDSATEYIPNLDPRNLGYYTRPPETWKGVKTEEELKVFVTEEHINDKDPTIIGDVDQSLFLQYDNYYVREVTAQDDKVTVLGAIEMGDAYVYYYMNNDDQNTDVSATTLPEGQKFIIRYEPNEHIIEYKVLLAGDEEDDDSDDEEEGISGDDITKKNIIDWITARLDNGWFESDTDPMPDDETLGIKDVTDKWEETIYGKDIPRQSDLGAYAFTAQAPDGYTLSFYMAVRDESGWSTPALKMATKKEMIAWRSETGVEGLYDVVNEGWALNEEPEYTAYSGGYKVTADTANGPQTLTSNGTFYNNLVKGDRIIVAVLRKKPEPVFNAYTIIRRSDGADRRGTFAKSAVSAKLRGTEETVTVPYDYEDEYLWRKETGRIKDGNANSSQADSAFAGLSEYTDYENGNPIGNIQSGDSWDWQRNEEKDLKLTMERKEDGTYSYECTFQTNSGDYLMDILEINRIGIRIPYFAKYRENNNNQEYPSEDDGGMQSWWTETSLPDGALVRVEYLMIFGSTQRVYRIKVDGAKNDITITGLNLCMYRDGADEFAIYHLDGVTGATTKGSSLRLEAIQYYDKGDAAKGMKPGWSDNQSKGNVIINSIDYAGGDEDRSSANFRFKLAKGYGNPYYLYESARDGVINGTGGEGDRQASIQRVESTGQVDRTTQNPVVPYVADGTKPYMKYDQETGEPYPVDMEGNPLYVQNEAGELEQFTDWDAIRIRVVEEADGSTREVLSPELYNQQHELLDVNHVIYRFPDGDGDEKDREEIKLFQWDKDVKLKSQYIYGPDSDGWYYIRVSTQGDYKIALLTIVAHPMRYVIRYWPNMLPEVDNGEEIIAERPPANMPEIQHSQECPLFSHGTYPDRPNWQFDDNLGAYFDIEIHPDVAIHSSQPNDPNGYYQFAGWQVVDEDFEPVYDHVLDENGRWAKDRDGNYIYYEVVLPQSGQFGIGDYTEFAILNGDLGTTATDIYVLRLAPKWDKIPMPYHYRIALNWVDALGNLHEEYFDELWRAVVTDHDAGSGALTVKVLTESTPLQNWIARHPTYAFWDDVNNATSDREILAALDDYFPKDEAVRKEKDYESVKTALLKKHRDDNATERDEFARQGNYVYSVLQDRGTIVVWMYEDKGGLVFHKDVEAEPFMYDDEFYFTVDQVKTGDNGGMLNGDFKAYPETVYNEDGTERELLDRDAWWVRFRDGSIENIRKNDGSPWPSSSSPVTYFTLHNGEGILLSIPGGRYTVRELGSKSGGSYMANVEYMDADGNTKPKESWVLPEDTQWLKGSRKVKATGADSQSQVPATVEFAVGEHDVVRALYFSNLTSTVALEEQVVGPYGEERFGFEVTLDLPNNTTPLRDENGRYYFNFNLYNVEYAEGAPAEKPMEPAKPDPPVEEDEEAYQKWLEWHNWRPDGTLTPVSSGRMVVVKDSTRGDNTWVSQNLLIQERSQDGSPTGSWKSSDSIRLQDGQRFYVVCTVPVEGEMNYTIEETDLNGYRMAGGDSFRRGEARAAELAYQLFINSKLDGLPATGGAGIELFLASGKAFLLSGLGLAWLSLWGKRRRRLENRAS